MISVEEALAQITAGFSVLAAEQVSLANAHGRVLAEDIHARRTQPPTAVSAMDGYAVRATDVASVPAVLRRVGEAPAGGAYDGTVGPGEAVRIFTGGPMPDGTDAVVIQEDTEADGDRVTVRESAPVGHYIRPAGLDFSAGEIGLSAGRVLSARDIGFAAAMDRPWLLVRRRPRIAILATGDEVVMPGDPVGPNQIVSSNSHALAAFVTASGGEPFSLGIAPDDPAALQAMVAGARGADLLVTTGGASVGDYDLVRSAFEAEGLELDFWRVAMRPGKPLLFGRLGHTPFLGVPGNPVSTLVCAVIFLGPVLDIMLGIERRDGPAATAILTRDLGPNDRRQDYLRATLGHDAAGNLVATPFEKQDSSMISLMARADCLVVRKPHAPAAAAGSEVEIIPLTGGIVGI